MDQFGSRWKSAAKAVAAGGFAFTLATSGALAQETATPESGTVVAEEGTSSAGGSGVVSAEQPAVTIYSANAVDKVQLTESIQQLTDTIALVQTDRDSVSGTIDVTEIDELLAKATELRDAARATLETDDVSTAPQAIFEGLQSATAAHGLIEAGVSAYGLPSQQARASRVLVQAYYTIDGASSSLKEDAGANASFFTESAKRLYAQAYELYNAGTYAQAERTAAVAQQVALIGNPAFGFGKAGFITPSMTIAGEAGFSEAGGVDVAPNAEAGVVVGGNDEAGMKSEESHGGTSAAGKAEGGIAGGGPANVEIEVPRVESGAVSIAGGDGSVTLIPVDRGGFEGPFAATAGISGANFSTGIVFSLGGPDASATPLEVPAPNFD